MINSKNLFILLFALTTFLGCQKDSETFIAHGETEYTSTIFGIVTDENHDPIEFAKVQYGSITKTTDKFGLYEFKDVEVGDQHSFLIIQKSGYFTGCRTFRTDKSKTITQETQLMTESFDQNFNSSNGATITEGDITLEFPQNAIINDNDNSSYSGEVQVSIAVIDPTDPNSAFQMPGDLSSINQNDELEALTSFGMVYVNLQAPNGDKLQIKSGEKVTMTSVIPADLLADAPDQLPMWYFDNESGLWKEEGVATKNGTEYIAEVGHFSCWNYDYSEPSITLCGRLIDEDGDPVTAHILFAAEGATWGGHGITNSDGTFCGRVTKDKLLNVSLVNVAGCNKGNLFIKQVGPFSADANIGDIVMPSTDPLTLSIEGTFEDCNNDAITSGFVTINNHHFPITNGEINAELSYCGSLPSTLAIKAVDRNGLKSMETTVNVTSNSLDLGTLSVCQNTTDYITVECTNLNFDETLLESISIWPNGSDSSGLYGGTWNGKASMSISYKAGSSVEGTFAIEYCNFRLNENNGASGYPKYFMRDPSGTITVIKDTSAGVYKGTYSVTVTSEDQTETQTFTGEYWIKY